MDSWVFFAFFGTFLFALSSIIDKITISNYFKKPTFQIASGLLYDSIAIGLLFLVTKIVIPSNEILIAGIACGLCLLIALYLFYKAIASGEVSVVMISYQIIPVFVLILATVFLKEVLSLNQYIGMALLLIGSLIVSIEKTESFKLKKASIFIIISALFFSINQILYKFMVDRIDPANAFFWSQAIFPIIFLGIFAFNSKYFIETIKNSKKGVVLDILSEFATLGGRYAATIALAGGFVILVSGIISTLPLMVFILATILSILFPKILKEEINRQTIMQKGIAIILVIAGTILVS